MSKLGSLRNLERMQEIADQANACPVCDGVEYLGIPGAFASIQFPKPGGTPLTGTHRPGTAEEFAEYFWGCPACGEDVKTVPIMLHGLQHKSRPGEETDELEKPQNIREWGPVTQGKPDQAEYNAQINELWS